MIEVIPPPPQLKIDPIFPQTCKKLHCKEVRDISFEQTLRLRDNKKKSTTFYKN